MAKMRWSDVTVTGTLLAAAVFAFLALNATWAYDGDPETFSTGYEMGAVTAGNDDDRTWGSLGNQGLDDFDGVGLARAGTVLAVIGTGFLIVGVLALEHRFFIDQAWLGMVGMASAAVATLLWIVALILFPIGVSGLSESRNFGFAPDLTWSAGLYFGIIACVLMLGGVLTGLIVKAIDGGFKLELAETTTGPADFD